LSTRQQLLRIGAVFLFAADGVQYYGPSAVQTLSGEFRAVAR
jgi:hypothetical protein